MASVITAGTASNTALNLTGDTSGELQLKTNNGSTTALTLTTGGNIGIGTSSPGSNVLQTLQYDSGTINTALRAVSYGVSPSFNFSSAGGTAASPTATTSNPMNLVGSTSSDGTNFFNTVGIVGGIESTPTAGSHPTFVAISTSSSGATSRTERMRINSNGNIGLQGATLTASGVGITFPATQSASSDANCLDDYEEGTWTPVLSRDGTAPTITYGARDGRYTKIGNMVTCWITINNITVSSAGSGNNVITGLPFTVGNITYGGTGGFGYNDAFANTVYGVVLLNNQTQIYFRGGTRSSGNEAGGWSSGGYLGLTFTYFV